MVGVVVANGSVGIVKSLTILSLCLMLLLGHLVYLVVTNPTYFPINTVKITANYQHISRSDLESLLAPYLRQGLYGFSVTALHDELSNMPWTQSVKVARIWPDTLSVVLEEREPFARWNEALITADGVVFKPNIDSNEWRDLPSLRGPEALKEEVLATYARFSKQLNVYGLSVHALRARDNHAWEMRLTNGLLLRLGKQDIEARVHRFCRAYPAVFSGKVDQLLSVDLRYAHGMAVRWRSPQLPSALDKAA